jgi:hypothetical protein
MAEDSDFVPLTADEGHEHVYTVEQIEQIKKTAKLGKLGVPLRVLERKLHDLGVPDPKDALRRFSADEDSIGGETKPPKKRPLPPPGNKPQHPPKDARPPGPPPPSAVSKTNVSSHKPPATVVASVAGPIPDDVRRRPPQPPSSTVTTAQAAGESAMSGAKRSEKWETIEIKSVGGSKRRPFNIFQRKMRALTTRWFELARLQLLKPQTIQVLWGGVGDQ